MIHVSYADCRSDSCDMHITPVTPVLSSLELNVAYHGTMLQEISISGDQGNIMFCVRGRSCSCLMTQRTNFGMCTTCKNLYEQDRYRAVNNLSKNNGEATQLIQASWEPSANKVNGPFTAKNWMVSSCNSG
jgi:hypothetical protein